MLPAERPVGFQQIVHARQTPVGINRAANPVAAAAPSMPMMPGVPLTSTVNVAMQKLPISGFAGGGGPRGSVFGQDEPPVNGNGNGQVVEEPDKPISAVELAIWGLLAGAGVGIVWSVAKGKKGLR
jgi:hypothetical protein